MKKVSTMLAMIAASEAMTSSYDYEYRGGDLLLKRKSDRQKEKSTTKKEWYTADSPEVKAMRK